MSTIYHNNLKIQLENNATSIVKTYLLYELESFYPDVIIDDELVERIYQAYLDHKNFNSVYDFICAIVDWCEGNDKSLVDLTVEEFYTMFSEI